MKKQTITPELLQVINNVAEEKLNVHDFGIDLKSGNKKGEGFLGEIFFVSLHDKRKNEDKEFVIKKAFSEDVIRSTVPIKLVFLIETRFYSKIWPAFVEFQEKLRVIDKFDKIPKCFLTSTDDKCELIALENLKSRGFETFDKKKIFDDSHIKLIFQQYGRFHGLSFAYRHHYPDEYAKLLENKVDVLAKFSEMDGSEANLNKICERSFQCLNSDIHSDLIKKLEGYKMKWLEKYTEGYTYNDKYSAITHGDCWSNNMMFKYDDSRNVLDITLIDFQLCRSSTPVCDLSYCLYSGGDKKAYDKLDEYLLIYHDSFSKFLRQFDCDPETEYPLKALKEDWKKHSKFGMVAAIMVIKMKLTNQDEVVDLTDLANGMKLEDMDMPCDEEELHRRYRDLFTHMNEINAL